jgi:hypothetical protein
VRVAVVCIAKNEDRYIHEWLDYHRKLGVDEFFVYENDWRSGLTLDYVRTIPFDGRERQQNAYNHFLFNLGSGIDWAAFIDLDEFIMLRKHTTIQEFLTEYGDMPEDVDGIALNWLMYGDNEQTEETGSVLERFTRRGTKPDRHIKMILRLNGNQMMIGPHCSYGFWMDTNRKFGKGQNNFDGTHDVAAINHYFCKTPKEYEQKMMRGRADWHEPRPVEDYDFYNQNEVEDLTALNFYRN